MNSDSSKLSENIVRTILDIVAPRKNKFEVQALDGSYSNETVLVKLESEPWLVIRRYNPKYSGYDLKANREFKTLELLHEFSIAVPAPRYMDSDGSVMGLCGIVTEYVRGERFEARPETWKNKIEDYARKLAQIHAISIDPSTHPFLMDGNKESVWFLKDNTIPSYVTDYHAGTTVWNTILKYLPYLRPVPPVLLHLDYWSGNVLWNGDTIVAVVDWEEAAYGDPAVDVAYARMDLFLEGLDGDEFLRVYEAETGKPLENLSFWELATAVRAMTDLSGWLTRPHMDERFDKFVTNALRRTK